MIWVSLTLAVVCEVTGTLALRMAAQPGARRAWYAVVALGYPAAFALMSLALHAGAGVGFVYGVWAATGVALTALASRFLFGEPLTRVMLLGLGLIVAGVLLIELGAGH